MVFLPVGGSNRYRTRNEVPRADGHSAWSQGIPPELSNLMNQVLATERIEPLRRGISPAPTSLRGWTAADATHLHRNIFIFYIFSEKNFFFLIILLQNRKRRSILIILLNSFSIYYTGENDAEKTTYFT